MLKLWDEWAFIEFVVPMAAVGRVVQTCFDDSATGAHNRPVKAGELSLAARPSHKPKVWIQPRSCGWRLAHVSDDLGNRFPAARISAALKQWLEEQRQKVTDGSATARAIDFSRRLWQALTRYRTSYLSEVLVLARVKLVSMGMRA